MVKHKHIWKYTKGSNERICEAPIPTIESCGKRETFKSPQAESSEMDHCTHRYHGNRIPFFPDTPCDYCGKTLESLQAEPQCCSCAGVKTKLPKTMQGSPGLCRCDCHYTQAESSNEKECYCGLGSPNKEVCPKHSTESWELKFNRALSDMCDPNMSDEDYLDSWTDLKNTVSSEISKAELRGRQAMAQEIQVELREYLKKLVWSDKDIEYLEQRLFSKSQLDSV